MGHIDPSALSEYIINAKKEYRLQSQAKTWEDKVSSIQRMKIASKLAKNAMSRAQIPIEARYEGSTD